MTALIMHLIPVLPIRLAGYIFIGLIIHGLAALMHEGVHGNIFRKASLDRWFSFAVGLPALVSATAFRANHMHHHQHNRTEHDPDEMTTVANTPGKLRLILNLWLFFGAFYFILVHIPLNGWRLASRKERRKILLEYGIIVTVFSTIFSLSSLNGSYAGILHYWAFPWVFTAIFTNIRGWTEHVFTVPGNPLTETRTIRSNRLISFLSANVNYHLEHHLFPAIPWYNLPKVHNLLQAEYKEAGAFVHSSYMRYVLRALCTNTNDVVRETGKPCLSRFLSVIFILSLLGSQLNAQHLRESEQHLIFGDSAYTAFDYKLALAAYEKSY
ncbi:MAG: fatty acid desaturase, partial [Bacteroidota bacterium]